MFNVIKNIGRTVIYPIFAVLPIAVISDVTLFFKYEIRTKYIILQDMASRGLVNM